MVAAGCDGIFDMTRHAAMLLGAIGAAGRAVAMLATSDRHLRRYPFDTAVLIDSPMLHLPLAQRAQAVGVPVLYYIAPQLWAWGERRVHKLRNRVDRLAVILPFEQEYFRERGVNATYVGHPLVDGLAERPADHEVVMAMRSRGHPVIGLFPGSRKHVVAEVFRGQLEVAGAILAAMPQAALGVSVANQQVAPIIARLLEGSRLPIRSYTDHHRELIESADLALVASGTTTLEVAFHLTPMIVMYNASRVFYHLVGRWLVHAPHLSLPNILAGREIVPEFMPYYISTAPIARVAIDLLQDDEARRKMVLDLEEMVSPLRDAGASARVAAMLLEMVESRHQDSTATRSDS